MGARHGWTTLGAVAGACLLTACGSPPADAPPATRTVTVAPSSSAPPSSDPSAPSPSASSPAGAAAPDASSPVQPSAPARRPGVPAEAYAGAGGPIPPQATKVQTLYTSPYGPPQAVLVSPSRNIGCELGPEYAGCGVESMIRTQQYGDTPAGPNWWFSFDPHGKGRIGSKSDVPNYTGGNGGPKGQVVDYGQVVYYDRYVCASEQAGMTCWDSSTGHGVFMNKKQMTTF